MDWEVNNAAAEILGFGLSVSDAGLTGSRIVADCDSNLEVMCAGRFTAWLVD